MMEFSSEWYQQLKHLMLIIKTWGFSSILLKVTPAGSRAITEGLLSLYNYQPTSSSIDNSINKLVLPAFLSTN